MANQTNTDFLRLADICALMSCGPRNLHTRRTRGTFPQPFDRVYDLHPIWRKSDIEDFIAGRATVAEIHARYKADRQEAAA